MVNIRKGSVQMKPTLSTMIVDLLKENPLLTRAEIGQRLGVEEQRIKEYVSRLKKSGALSEKKILIPQNRDIEINVR